MRFLEYMTGGARPDDRVPMIVALHPMGGDPEDFLPLFSAITAVPGSSSLTDTQVVACTFGMTPLLKTSPRRWLHGKQIDSPPCSQPFYLRAPTIGKPPGHWFLAGGIMTFALAVTHRSHWPQPFPWAVCSRHRSTHRGPSSLCLAQ